MNGKAIIFEGHLITRILHQKNNFHNELMTMEVCPSFSPYSCFT
jgi:hypothetical protein